MSVERTAQTGLAELPLVPGMLIVFVAVVGFMIFAWASGREPRGPSHAVQGGLTLAIGGAVAFVGYIAWGALFL